ncbi:hypothetical protein ACFL6H_04710 [Candidatus Latescibacterota bacterium]
MGHLKHIHTVSKTEAKIFSRSWIFRFFVVFTFIMLGAGNVWLFSHNNSNWQYRCISSSPAYFNLLLLTLIQSLIVPFGAIESLRNEIKLDMYESIHARSFTNTNHIIGKAVGIMIPILAVNAVVLVGALVYNVVFADDVPVVWQAYILYPLILSIPSLFFMTCVSFFVMSIFRSQPLSLITVLGYYLFSIAYGVGYGGRLIDFTGFHLPMLYSDFVGIENIREILLHRLLYFTLGFGLLTYSCILFKRLIQSNVSRRVTMAVVVICLFLSPGFIHVYMLDVNNSIKLRQQMNELNRKYVSFPRTKISGYSLDIDHTGRNLDIKADITLSNPYQEPIDTLIFTLNPGFEIESISSDGNEVKFVREIQIIKVIPETPIIPGHSMVFTINYTGTVDNNACYIDIDEDYRAVINRLFAFAVDKRYGFVTPDYVLLTPECTWYPVSGIPYGWVFPDAQWKDFSDFKVKVATSEGLSVISQADVMDNRNGNFSFKTDEKLTGLTFIIGEYEKKAVVVDGVEFVMYLKPGHDYFSQYFTDAEQIVKEVIANEKQNYERTIGMKYPFSRYMLIESPVQFMAYQRSWRTHTELIQPQMAIIPEKGAFIRGSNIRTRYETAKSGEYAGLTGIPFDDDEAIMQNIIWQFIRFRMFDDAFALEEIKQRQNQTKMLNSRSMYRIFNNIHTEFVPSYTFSAQFYPFLTSIDSEEYPIFPFIVEFYRKNREILFTRPTRQEPILPEEIVCLEMANRSFADILTDNGTIEDVETLLSMKASQLFIRISADIGEENFNEMLNSYFIDNEFQTTRLSQFLELLDSKTGIDYSDLFESWYREQSMPEFIIDEPTITEIIVNNRTMYQTIFRIHNISEVDGVVWSELEESRQDGLFHQRIITLNPHQSKEIGILTDLQPQRIVINMLVSKNIPILYNQYIGSKLRENHDGEPFDDIRIIDYSPPSIDPNAIIVDNLDQGFKIISDPTEKYNLTRAIANFGIGLYPEDFVSLCPGLQVPIWAKAVFIKGYGQKSSAYYTSPGNGDGRVLWTAHIEDAGLYDLEYYFHDTSSAMNYGGGRNDPIADLPLIGEYNFTVTYSSTSNNIIYTPSRSGGWQYLGSFELEPGKVTVELTNKSTGRFIYADAIRWVKK